MWDILKRHTRPCGQAPETLRELHQVIPGEWNNIPMPKVNKLIQSMTSKVCTDLLEGGVVTTHGIGENFYIARV